MSAAPGVLEQPRAFHLLAKPTGAVCNLDCSYCFFLSKEMLYPGSRLPHGGRIARGIRQAADRGACGRPRSRDRLARRGTDAHGRRFLPPLGRAGRGLSSARPAGDVHDPDERDAPRRRVGGVLQGQRLPGRDLDRRATRAPRHLSREQRRERQFRPGDAWALVPQRRRSRVECPDDGARRQRRSRPRGLPLSSRRMWRPLHPVHPDHRAGRGSGRGRNRSLGVVARPAALRPGR